MYYTANIYDPEAGLEQIHAAASKFNPERFLYALEYKNYDEKDLERMAVEVATYRQKLQVEHNRLVEFAEIFNKQFATMNNSCFNSALNMLHKLKSGISEAKRIFMKFCPRARRETIRLEIAKNPVSAYSHAYICADNYQLPLFKLNDYPDCVSGLFHEMEQFFCVLLSCIKVCKQVLVEEKKIKKDNKYCKYLFDQFKANVLREIADIIMMIPRDSEYLSEEMNPAIASRSRYENDEAWAPVGFHNYSRAEVKRLIIKQELDKEEGSDISRIERLLFGDDEAKIRNIRHIILNFDQLIPDDYKRKNLPARYIQMFIQFVGIPYKLEHKAVDYFNELYSSSSTNKYKKVTYQAVNSYKKDVLKDQEGEYKTFTENVKRLFYKPRSWQNASNF